MIRLTWMTKLTDAAMFVGKKTQLQDGALCSLLGTLLILPGDCAAPAVLWECPGNLWSKQPPAFFARHGLGASQFGNIMHKLHKIIYVRCGRTTWEEYTWRGVWAKAGHGSA